MKQYLHPNKKQSVKKMISEIERYATRLGVSLENKIPDDVNGLDDVFNDGGVGRCEHFTDHALDYAIQFGTLEDYGNKNGCMAHQWSCIETAMKTLRKKHNKH